MSVHLLPLFANYSMLTPVRFRDPSWREIEIYNDMYNIMYVSNLAFIMLYFPEI